MTLNANPHKNYKSMLKVGRRKPLMSRRRAVQKNSSVVVKLSEGAVALSEIQGLEKLNSADRTERIEGLKEAIQDGRYRVDSFLIAPRPCSRRKRPSKAWRGVWMRGAKTIRLRRAKP